MQSISSSISASGVDYVPLVNEPLTVPADSAMGFIVCSAVLIKGDLIRENDDTFNVILDTVHENDGLTLSTFRVVIEDDGDSEYLRT